MATVGRKAAVGHWPEALGLDQDAAAAPRSRLHPDFTLLHKRDRAAPRPRRGPGLWSSGPSWAASRWSRP